MEESRRNDLIHMCRELLRRPSVSGREGDVARYVAETMRSLGYDSVIVDSYGNVVGRMVFSGEGERMLCTAQMDHVDAGDAAEWSKYPFGAFIENCRIYGRAASDQKGALSAMIMAGAFLKADKGRFLKGELAIAAAVHQETFESVASQAIGDYVNPTCVIAGEASGLYLERGQRGLAEIRMDTFGKMTHSSHPEFGVNAAETMNDLLSFLKREFVPPRESFLGEGVLVLTSLFTTPVSNSGAVPEKCTAIFDRRLLQGETMEGVARDLEKIIEKAAAVTPGLRALVSFPVMEDRCYTGAPIRGNHFAPAWVLPHDSPYLQTLSRALADSGLPSKISSRPGFGTNGCYYAVNRKLPTVIYGPSGRELAHGVDEYIEIDELLGACEGYYAMAGCLLADEGGEKESARRNSSEDPLEKVKLSGNGGLR